MRILSRIIFVAMLAMTVIIIPLGAATIIMAIELGLLFEALSGMLMLCVYIALSLYEVARIYCRDRMGAAGAKRGWR